MSKWITLLAPRHLWLRASAASTPRNSVYRVGRPVLAVFLVRESLSALRPPRTLVEVRRGTAFA
jgi:hypothetical protein